MSFNELNSVENFIIQQLSGVNLNQKNWQERQATYGFMWKYKPAVDLERGVQEVMVEKELREALIRLNPEIEQRPERADEVIYRLRAILIKVNHTGLVRANEEFTRWMQGDKTMPFGENNRHVPVKLIDFEQPENNSYIITDQYRYHARETKIPDIVLLINGIPVVIGEAKTPIRFYLNDEKNYKDDYTHGHPLQKTSHRWYFHGSGIDITFGNDAPDDHFSREVDCGKIWLSY